MKSLTLKNKINILSVIACLVMVVLQLVLQFIKKSDIQLLTILFTISGIIYIGYILFREFVKRDKYTIFISYIILLLLFVIIILIFNLLAKSTTVSIVLFIGSFIFSSIAFILSIVALFHDLDWYKKNVMIYAHISASIGVILTAINLILNYTWNNNEGNMILFIICISMLNVMIEALIRSLKIEILAFFADNYLLTGLASILLIIRMLGVI